MIIDNKESPCYASVITSHSEESGSSIGVSEGFFYSKEKEKMKDKKPLDWIPVYIDKHLFGSTRLELEPDERSVWMDLLVLAGKDNGYVRANEGVPYPREQLAGLFLVSEELLNRTIKKCSSIKIKKIAILKDKTLYLPSWIKYTLSPRHKRRFNSTDVPMNGHDVPEQGHYSKRKSNSNSKSKRIEEKKKPVQKVVKNKITFNFEKRKFINITIEDKAGWLDAYQACDINQELSKMREWLLANPSKKKKNYRRFITNWLTRTQDKGGSKKSFSGGYMSKRNRDQKEIDDLVSKYPKVKEGE